MKKHLLIAACCAIAFGAQAQLQNGNMENWRTYTSGGVSLEAPTSWSSSDSTIASLGAFFGIQGAKQVFKSTDKHGGTYAAQLKSHNYGSVAGVLPAAIANAKLNVNPITQEFSVSGGTAVTTRMNSVSAWLKFQPGAATDSATFLVAAVLAGTPGADGQDSVVGEGLMKLSTMTSYTQMTVNITYTSTATPNRIQIGFVSGNVDDLTSNTDGSTLYVDDVVINGPNGIIPVAFNADVVKCYPNPASGTLYLNAEGNDALRFEALNAAGQVIARTAFNGKGELALGSAAAGIYYFRVFDRSNTLVQTGKFSIR